MNIDVPYPRSCAWSLAAFVFYGTQKVGHGFAGLVVERSLGEGKRIHSVEPKVSESPAQFGPSD